VHRVLAVALVILVLAGCGGRSAGNGGGYAQGLSSSLSGVGQPSSLDAASLARLGDDYSRAAEQLAKLAPPAAVAEAHSRMVASMRAYAAALTRASALTADPAAFASEMALAQTDARSWTAAFDEIRNRGYATYSAGGTGGLS